MIIAYTLEYERLISSWPSTPTVGTWIDYRNRGSHVHDRVGKGTAMTVARIAEAVGLPVAVLTEAYQRWCELYAFGVIEDERHALTAERWQKNVVGAFDRLADLGVSIVAPGLRSARWMTPCEGQIEEEILRLLTERPEGVVDAIAACLVLLASTPEEVDEAELRRIARSSSRPELIREVERTPDVIGQLWNVPATRHHELRDVELLLVHHAAPLIRNPSRPASDPRRDVMLGRRSDGESTVTVVGGPRDGEELGKFSCTDGRRAVQTYKSLEQLHTTGALAPTEPPPGRHSDGGGGA